MLAAGVLGVVSSLPGVSILEGGSVIREESVMVVSSAFRNSESGPFCFSSRGVDSRGELLRTEREKEKVGH